MKKQELSRILKITGSIIIGLITLTFWFAAYGEKCIPREIEQCGNISATPCNIHFMDTDTICGDFGLFWFILMIIVTGTFIFVGVAWNT